MYLHKVAYVYGIRRQLTFATEPMYYNKTATIIKYLGSNISWYKNTHHMFCLSIVSANTLIRKAAEEHKPQIRTTA